MEVLGVVGKVLRIRVLATLRVGTVIAMVWIVVVIHVTIKIMRAVKPWPGSDEDAAAEPLRTIVPVGGALVRRG
jgi:hypothetical protein